MSFSKHFLPRLFFLVLFSPAAVSLHGQTTSKTELERKAQICSVFGAMVANAEAITRCDVIVLEQKFYDSVWPHAPTEGGTLDDLTISRFIIDDEEKKFVVVSRTISDWLELSKITDSRDGRTLRTVDRVVLCDREQKKIAFRQGTRLTRLSETNDKSIDQMLVLNLDPRSAGLYSSKLGPLPLAIELTKPKLTGESLIDHEFRKDTLKIRLVGGRINPASRPVWEYHLDTVSHLPQKFSSYLESIPPGVTSPPHETSYQWKEMAGLYVPNLVKSATIDEYLDPQGNKHYAKLTSSIHFHWLSVNEKIEEEIFDEGVLKDSKKFQELIDLEKNGAQELIEVLRKQNRMPKSDNEDDSIR